MIALKEEQYVAVNSEQKRVDLHTGILINVNMRVIAIVVGLSVTDEESNNIGDDGHVD